MKRKNLLFQFFLAVGLVGFLGLTPAIGQTTLKHSYTFEDGTAVDVVGEADGVLQGDAVISDGSATFSGTGFISLPGKEINIPSYESVTVEAFFTQTEGLSGNSTLFSFGETNMEPGWPMGINYLIFQPTRDDGTARAAISTLNTSNPWETEDGVNREEMITDIQTHHVVTVLTGTDMTMYLDGKLMGTTEYTGDNSLSAISADTAYIGHIVYTDDAKWQGSVEEMNIYEGVMEPATVDQKFKDFMGDAFFDPSLAVLSANKGEITPEFSPMELDYQLYVPYGTSSINIEASPTVSGADVAVFDGAGEELSVDSAITVPSDGIDLEIVVTALAGTTEASYYLSVFHDPADEAVTLSNIELSSGALVSPFHMDSVEYSAIVPHGAGSVDVTAIPTWEGASVAGDGSIDITGGTATVSITVTSGNGENTETYTVDLYESEFTTGKDLFIQHESSELVIGEDSVADDLIRLYYPLNNKSDQLFQFEQSGEEGQYLVRDQTGRYLQLQAGSEYNMEMKQELPNDLDSARFMFNEFEPGRFWIISVTKENLGVDGKYMGPNNNDAGGGVFSDKAIDNDLIVWNIKDPADLVGTYDTFLDTLGIDVRTLKPGFIPNITEYFVTIPIGVSSLNVEAATRSEASTVSGTGEVELDDRGTITVTVTAEDPEYTRDYVITYVHDTELTLKHSYSFTDGTARDTVGTAHGDVNGGTVVDGAFQAEEEGDYIVLPAEEIAINEYPSITLEAYVVNGENPSFTMLAYFGGLSGANSYWLQPTRRDDTDNRTEIITGSTASAQKVPDLEDNQAFHLVSVLTNDSISYYVDGVLVGTDDLDENNYIAGISTENAWLGYGGWSDPTWLGSMLEVNIFSGVMDATTVAERSANFPIENQTSNAALDTLALAADTTMLEGFDHSNFNYEIVLDTGATEIPELLALAATDGASVNISAAADTSEATVITVTSEDGNYINTYTVIFTSPVATGIAQPQVDSNEPELIVYPTISNGSFTLEAEDELGIVTVYNLAGQVVSQENVQSSTTEINVPRTGMYIIHVQSGNQSKVFKVIKTN